MFLIQKSSSSHFGFIPTRILERSLLLDGIAEIRRNRLLQEKRKIILRGLNCKGGVAVAPGSNRQGIRPGFLKEFGQRIKKRSFFRGSLWQSPFRLFVIGVKHPDDFEFRSLDSKGLEHVGHSSSKPDDSKFHIYTGS